MNVKLIKTIAVSPVVRSLSIAATALCAGLVCGHVLDAARAETVQISPIYSATGPARVGGPFTLIGTGGEMVSNEDFRGKYMLVYFGYTWCPDVCPGELQKVSDALDELGDLAVRVQPLFITIDPERDTAAVLAEYASHFHRSLIGLTGTREQIKSAAKTYRVLTRKDPRAAGKDYLIAHTSNVFLMDQEGRYVAHFPYGFTVAQMVAGLKGHLDDR